MPETRKIAHLLERLTQGVAAHNRENPGHHTWGIGMSGFDIERLDLEPDEEILPGIILQIDGGVTGNFRVLCDGQHDEGAEETEEEVLDAVAEDQIAEPLYSPGYAAPPPVRPPI